MYDIPKVWYVSCDLLVVAQTPEQALDHIRLSRAVQILQAKTEEYTEVDIYA